MIPVSPHNTNSTLKWGLRITLGTILIELALFAFNYLTGLQDNGQGANIGLGFAALFIVPIFLLVGIILIVVGLILQRR